MWVNEEGKLSDDPIQNPTGTALWVDNYGETDVIIGNIIFTGGTDANGHTLGLSDEQLNSLLNYTKTAIVENLEIEDFTSFSVREMNF